MIPFMDREQRRIGFWFTDGAGRRWAVIGLVYGALTTALCVASSLLLPVRELFSGFESQAFFDLVRPDGCDSARHLPPDGTRGQSGDSLTPLGRGRNCATSPAPCDRR